MSEWSQRVARIVENIGSSAQMKTGCLCQSVELFLHGRCNFPHPAFLLVLFSPPLPPSLLLIFTYGAPHSKAPFHAQAPAISASSCPSSTTTIAIPLHRHYPRRAANPPQFQESCTLMTSAQPTILLFLLLFLFHPRQTPSRRHGSVTGQSLSRG